ncbi:hypothetical protein, partial [Chamaesiphon sp. OTE_75_metabat_556]|uniref:hypothetical protein n=1 Tax=Chamaesiphon sp. OTE_75_metabat_556 TaxID=2964692 RepID=UPI00286BB42F
VGWNHPSLKVVGFCLGSLRHVYPPSRWNNNACECILLLNRPAVKGFDRSCNIKESSHNTELEIEA